MCMHINESIKAKKTRDGWLTAYKVVEGLSNLSPCLSSHRYTIGENISDRTKTTLSKKEKGVVIKGFHLFTNKVAARKWMSGTGTKTIQVFYKPEDVVAYGYTIFNNKSLSTVVVTKLTVKSLNGVK